MHTPGHTFPSRLPVVGTACTCLTDGETEADKYNLPQVTQLISGQPGHGWGGSGARVKPPRRVPPGPRRLRRSALWGPGTIPLAFCKVLPKTNHLTAPAWVSIFQKRVPQEGNVSYPKKTSLLTNKFGEKCFLLGFLEDSTR